MRKSIIIIAIIFSLISGIGMALSHLITNTYMQTLSLSISVSLLQLVLGIVIVNLYIDKKSKSNIARAFLVPADRCIATYHNTFLDVIGEEFGQKQWREIITEYLIGNGDPSIIALNERKRVFDVVKNNYEKIKALLYNSGEQMSEMTKSGILTFDDQLHSHAWAAKETARRFLKIDINAEDVNVTDVFECCVDFDIHTQIVRARLYDLVQR